MKFVAAHTHRPFRHGMTLIEMLVATAATLMLMAAVAQVFSVFGSAVTNSRSTIELDGRLRTVAWKLRQDLAGATARTLPPLEPQAGEGYFEIIEGTASDSDAAAGETTLAADIDDVLLFTTRNSETPFLGKAGTGMVESSAAEVAWFLRQTSGEAATTTYTLFRRQLLVVGYPALTTWALTAPYSANGNYFTTQPNKSWPLFYDNYDISVRLVDNHFVPNTLADLTRPEARFMHNPTGATNNSALYAFAPGAPGLVFESSNGSARVGEDVVLTNVLAFDIRVFDPAVPIRQSGPDAVVPNDPGFVSAGLAIANGGYVDLGHGETAGPSNIAPHFAGNGQGNYRDDPIGLSGKRTWDTWSTHYESNGLDEDGVAGPDQGSDGFDNSTAKDANIDNSNGQVDEPEEYETSPPYPFPLRGIEIRIRCFEPSSRQVRQVTVRHTFIPH